MRTREVLGELHRGEYVPPIQETLDRHFASITKAYDQAGLSPRQSLHCPGVSFEDGDMFQVDKTSVLGDDVCSHFLINNQPHTYINEGDICLRNGQFDEAPGRILDPTRSEHCIDYLIDDEILGRLTDFIEELHAAGLFVAVIQTSLLAPTW